MQKHFNTFSLQIDVIFLTGKVKIYLTIIHDAHNIVVYFKIKPN